MTFSHFFWPLTISLIVENSNHIGTRFAFRFFFRVFNMAADINSGTIFALLPLNGVFCAISMYNVEHVNIFFFQVSNNFGVAVVSLDLEKNSNFNY